MSTCAKTTTTAKPKAVRVRTGCRSCRVRRVGCKRGDLQSDGSRMPCGGCVRNDLDCWYPNGKDWVPSYQRKAGVGGKMEKGKGRASTASTSAIVAPDWDDIETISSWQTNSSLSSHSPTSSNSSSPVLPFGLIRSFLHASPSFPSPRSPIVSFTLASFPLDHRDQIAVSYFEQRGFDEITSSSRSQNWMHEQMFPKLFYLLSSNAIGVSPPTQLYVLHSLLRLSYVHRANVEGNNVEAEREFKKAASEHANIAEHNALELKLTGEWHTEDCLMGFFINAMADMLGYQSFAIDSSVSFRLNSKSKLGSLLPDLICVYNGYLAACLPHESPEVDNAFRACEFPSESGEEAMEHFFGYSRRIYPVFWRVNKLVLERSRLLEAQVSSPTHSVQQSLLRAEAEKLACDLGEGWSWSEYWQEPGQSLRVRKGSNVMRLALRVMVLCELLDYDLGDSRIAQARSTVLELVADTEPSAMAAYCWPLAITAIYSRNPQERQDVLDVIHSSAALSFGPGYRGIDEVLNTCWFLYDVAGRYPSGIAPWRRALRLAGRSMFL